MLSLTPVTVLLGGVEHCVKQVLTLNSLNGLFHLYVPPADDKLLSRGSALKMCYVQGIK